MGYNVPVVTQDNFSFGPGVLYAGICGESPMTDIGAVRSGAELVITREKITVEQGSPYQRIVDYVIRETIVLTVTGIEWNFSNLQRAWGGGVVSTGTVLEGIWEFAKFLFVSDIIPLREMNSMSSFGAQLAMERSQSPLVTISMSSPTGSRQFSLILYKHGLMIHTARVPL